MTHSLHHANPRTHLKIVAVALAGAIAVVGCGIAARMADAGVTAPRQERIVVRAGGLTISATLDVPSIR